MYGVRATYFKARQPGFHIDRALYNLHRLSDHFIDVFRKMHENLAVFSFLPPLSDLRCNCLAFHLLLWELTAIFAPHHIRVDLFDLLLVRGGTIFNLYVIPEGQASVERFFKRIKATIMH